MTRIAPIALAAMIALPAHAGPWSLDYDLHGAATEAGTTAAIDLDLAYSFGHGRLFIAPHIPLGKPRPFRISTTTETVQGPCRCVTVNTTVNGYVAYDEVPSVQAGVAWDFSDHVTGSLFVDGARHGPAMVGVELSVHGRIGGE
jgi:hypothetical protein